MGRDKCGWWFGVFEDRGVGDEKTVKEGLQSLEEEVVAPADLGTM